MYVCMYIYIHTYILLFHLCTHTCIYIYRYVSLAVSSFSPSSAAISDSRISPLRNRGPDPCYIASMGLDSIDESKAG